MDKLEEDGNGLQLVFLKTGFQSEKILKCKRNKKK